jgi:hypothetical protein
MVVVNQMWMLQRLRPIVAACAAHASVTQWLQNFADADSLLTLDEMMAGYEIEKRGGKLFSSAR